MWTLCPGTEAATPSSPTGGPLPRVDVDVGSTWCQVRGRADGDRAAAGRVCLPQGGGARAAPLPRLQARAEQTRQGHIHHHELGKHPGQPTHCTYLVQDALREYTFHDFIQIK